MHFLCLGSAMNFCSSKFHVRFVILYIALCFGCANQCPHKHQDNQGNVFTHVHLFVHRWVHMLPLQTYEALGFTVQPLIPTSTSLTPPGYLTSDPPSHWHMVLTECVILFTEGGASWMQPAPPPRRQTVNRQAGGTHPTGMHTCLIWFPGGKAVWPKKKIIFLFTFPISTFGLFLLESSWFPSLDCKRLNETTLNKFLTNIFLHWLKQYSWQLQSRILCRLLEVLKSFQNAVLLWMDDTQCYVNPHLATFLCF